MYNPELIIITEFVNLASTSCEDPVFNNSKSWMRRFLENLLELEQTGTSNLDEDITEYNEGFYLFFSLREVVKNRLIVPPNYHLALQHLWYLLSNYNLKTYENSIKINLLTLELDEKGIE